MVPSGVVSSYLYSGLSCLPGRPSAHTSAFPGPRLSTHTSGRTPRPRRPGFLSKCLRKVAATPSVRDAASEEGSDLGKGPRPAPVLEGGPVPRFRAVRRTDDTPTTAPPTTATDTGTGRGWSKVHLCASTAWCSSLRGYATRTPRPCTTSTTSSRCSRRPFWGASRGLTGRAPTATGSGERPCSPWAGDRSSRPTAGRRTGRPSRAGRAGSRTRRVHSGCTGLGWALRRFPGPLLRRGTHGPSRLRLRAGAD